MCPVEIEDLQFFGVSELVEEVGVSRQTLWRWRNDGKIPAGHRYRDGRVLFTSEQVEEICRFANRLDPIKGTNRDQMKLFALEGAER